MKTKNLILKSIVLLTAASMFMTSCKKKEEEDNDTTSAADNALAEATYTDAANIADEAGQYGTLSSYKAVENNNLLATCATITLSNQNNTDQDTVVVDFGTANCVGIDGRSRRGKIIVYFSGKFKKFNSTHTITFDNFFVNDHQVEGTKTVTNNGLNSSGNLNWSISVNGKITLSTGGTITWASTRGRELLVGWNASDSTITWVNSKWSITGSASGTNSKGGGYTANITSALIRDFSCPNPGRRHFSQGIVDITPAGKATRSIDFGTGVCDDKAVVTIKSKRYNITLR